MAVKEQFLSPECGNASHTDSKSDRAADVPPLSSIHHICRWQGETKRFGTGRSEFNLALHDPRPLRHEILRRDPLPPMFSTWFSSAIRKVAICVTLALFCLPRVAHGVPVWHAVSQAYIPTIDYEDGTAVFYGSLEQAEYHGAGYFGVQMGAFTSATADRNFLPVIGGPDNAYGLVDWQFATTLRLGGLATDEASHTSFYIHLHAASDTEGGAYPDIAEAVTAYSIFVDASNDNNGPVNFARTFDLRNYPNGIDYLWPLDFWYGAEDMENGDELLIWGTFTTASHAYDTNGWGASAWILSQLDLQAFAHPYTIGTPIPPPNPTPPPPAVVPPDSGNTLPVPEPSTFALVGIGLAGICWTRWGKCLTA
ncbi:MAG: PEP-CTERM sorting domain-containing protein [Deltaproteobacteria bacterium]|nr:PEP-CTERM sorting domain-containing protein [Deltaproteobacteria bacterium]